jgi:hydrogenase maturation protease
MRDSLIIAVGNDARGDDGVGWEFAGRVTDDRADREFRYQLQIEDAELIAGYRSVLFVDACAEACDGGFSVEKVHPQSDPVVSTHRLSPQTVLALADSLYGVAPTCFLLRIDGVDFGLGRPISPVARRNLEAAFRAFADRPLFE